MNFRWKVWGVGLVVWAAVAVPVVFAETRALLIGVSQYRHLPESQLTGPANDVQILFHALQRLGIPAGQIRILADGVGKTDPTRAAIREAWDTLINQSRAGDWAIVYFAGHGSQQPQPVNRAAHAYAEPDGMDEIFLPLDADKWDERLQSVRNAILDDEIGQMLEALSKKGVKVWAIFDTCHAGGMSKAVTRATECAPEGCPVTRRLSPRTLGIPQPKNHLPAKTKPAPAASGQVLFFAAQPYEPAAEESLPFDPHNPNATEPKKYLGRFTYLLVQAMHGWKGDFSNLVHAVQERHGIYPYPTPVFQGDLRMVPDFAKKK